MKKNPEETHRRILDALVSLHEEVGPAATTISGVAERAGVQRLTVYRHFPDEGAMIGACSAHWRKDHPLPDPSTWAGIVDPRARLRRALDAIYAYFRDGRPMLARVLRDEAEIPALQEVMEPYHGYFREVAGSLSSGWGLEPGEQRPVRAAVGHALRFESWASLRSEGLDTDGAAELMARFVACAAGRE